ncbi:MAG: DUF268 domain-containing protein [Planctomycetota bacterium]|nr:DUF268 domain-containing protein [Planctomycetota bacterium]
MSVLSRLRALIATASLPTRPSCSANSQASASANLDHFKQQFNAFERHHIEARRSEPLHWHDRYPCLEDNTRETPFDRHYLYHPAWAARVLARTAPALHVDISSSLSFCTIASAFVPTEFYDFRPAPVVLPNLTCHSADLTNLHFPDDAIESLSCMHVIEHIGLGRYGDPLDADGDLKALAELVRVLKPSGDLLLAVPVGKSRVQFNAHRIYDHQTFQGYLGGLTLMEFALIPDGQVPTGYIVNPDDSLVRSQAYGCGCYWFKKE